jgi:hypothetical protein
VGVVRGRKERAAVKEIMDRRGEAFAALIAGVADPERRADCERLVRLIVEATGEKPSLWSGGVIGFGTYHYRYASGREGDAPRIGMAPRSQGLVLYSVIFYGRNTSLLGELGRHSAGKGCLTIKRLSHVDLSVLGRMVKNAYKASDHESPSSVA